ncbi:MAG: SPASM domain-containing protein, partial [Chloroflexi bacterium]|nr:SPASM domain-containing protein [Chloroflexota bacterium]
ADDLTFDEQAIIEAMEDAFAAIEANLPRHSLLGAIIDRARLDTLHDHPCGVGKNYLIIDQNGRVAKCQMEIERTITDVSVADPLAAIRQDTIHVQNPSVDDKEGCRECHWRYWCAGGCPALTFRANGRFDVKSPNCNIYKTLFPAVLRLEALRLLAYAV